MSENAPEVVHAESQVATELVRAERDLVDRLRKIRELSEELAGREAPEPDELRDAAVAAPIPAATVERLVPELRSLLGVVRAGEALAAAIAGEPRRVIDLEEELLTQARIIGGARRTVLDEPMLTSAEAGRRLGSAANNLRELARQLRERSELLGVPGRRGYLYPAFQVDAARQRIHPEVAEANRWLDAAGDPWGVASWWVSKDARLGARPMDLVGTPRAGEVALAARGLVQDEG